MHTATTGEHFAVTLTLTQVVYMENLETMLMHFSSSWRLSELDCPFKAKKKKSKYRLK